MSHVLAPIEVFCSYAPEDETWLRELEKHLALLKRLGLISTWHDRLVLPGTNWEQEMDSQLNNASVILLLISPDFLASDYCYGVEMQKALERQKNREIYVIPVSLRPVDFQKAPFAHLQCLPRDGRPVTSWTNQDEAFSDITRGLRLVVEHLRMVGRTHPLPPLPSWTANNQVSSQSRTNRERMLKRVRAFWIKGILEQSLHHVALITLGLHELPDAVANPWRLVMQEAEQPARALPPGTRITEVYDDADGELLILGEPGAGKTTLLLDLAHHLLNRADQDPTHPIPVVFNLSSWAMKQQSFALWLVEELSTKYQVPRKVGQIWVDTNNLLLLLDGLDEVAELQRSACIQTINAYRHEHAVGVIVCSRRAEYQAQATRIALQRAVLIQPLSTQQINDYLSNAGKQLQATRETLHTHPALLEIIQTPLMLSIVVLAFQEGLPKDFQREGASETLQQQILTMYVQRMLQRRGVHIRYTSQQTIDWLMWLARQMLQHRQTEFSIEQMQPDWLPKGEFYNGVTLKLFNGLVSVLVFGLVGGFIFGQIGGQLGGQVFGQVGGCVFAVIGGLAFGLVKSGDRERTSAKNIRVWPREKIWRGLIKSLTIGSVSGLIGSLVGVWIGNPPAILIGALSFGLVVGLVVGLIVELIVELVKIQNGEITPTEVLAWSWVKMWRSLTKLLVIGLVGGLFVGFTVGFLIGIVAWQLDMTIIGLVSGPLNPLIIGLVGALGVGAVGLLIGASGGGLVGGFSNETLERHNRIVPNQGIRRSVRNSLFAGASSALIGGLSGWLLFGVGVGLVNWIAFGQGNELLNALSNGLVNGQIGASIGLLVGMLVGWVPNGGAASTRHAILRLLLWQAGYIPWDYAQFLDYAAERILLRKVGGGYIFIHATLLNYFASLHQSSELNHERAPRQNACKYPAKKHPNEQA